MAVGQKRDRIGRLNQVMAASRKTGELLSDFRFNVAGARLTAEDLTSKLDAYRADLVELRALEAELGELRHRVRRRWAFASRALVAIHLLAEARFGPDGEELAQFGFRPKPKLGRKAEERGVLEVVLGSGQPGK